MLFRIALAIYAMHLLLLSPEAELSLKDALSISVTLGNTLPSVAVDYDFPWRIKEHEAKLDKVFEFWLNYHNNPKTNELISV